MKTRVFTFALAMLLMAGLSTLGCSSKPPKDADKATVSAPKPMPEETKAEDEVPEPDPDYKAEMVSEIVYEEPETTEEPASIQYTINNDDSSISWVGYGGIMGSMEGGFSVFSGTVDVSDKNLETTKVDLKVDMMSVFSDAKKLTEKLRGEEFFKSEEFPETTFQSTSIKRDTGSTYTVEGNLTLNGEAKSITFPAEIKVDGSTLTATAEFTFDRNAWGVDYEGVGDNFVEDDVLLRFEINAEA